VDGERGADALTAGVAAGARSVFVRLLGRTLCVEVAADTTAEGLVAQVAARACMPLRDARLTFAGRQLEDAATLSARGVTRDSTLDVVFRLCGGMSADPEDASERSDHATAGAPPAASPATPEDAATTAAQSSPPAAPPQTYAARAARAISVGTAPESTTLSLGTDLPSGMAHLVIVDRACTRLECFARTMQGVVPMKIVRWTLQAKRDGVPDREVCVASAVGPAALCMKAAADFNKALCADSQQRSPVGLACGARPSTSPSWLVRPQLSRTGEPVNTELRGCWAVRVIAALGTHGVKVTGACLVREGDGL